MFAHLAVAEPILYARVDEGNKSPEMVVVPKEVVPTAVKVPPKIALPEP